MRKLDEMGAFPLCLPLCGLLVFGWLGACTPTEEGAPTGNEARDPPAAGPATLDFAAVMRQVRLGYRPAGDGFAAEPGTYEIRVGADGTVRFTPFRFVEPGSGNGEQAGANAAPARDRDLDDTRVRGEALVVRTRAIARTGGGWASDSSGASGADAAQAPPTCRVEKDGSLAIERGPVVERWRNEDTGAEQSWFFAARPEGRGDLVISLEATGPAYAGLSAGGHHFADASAGVGARYGAATWVDARSRRTPISARYHGDRLVLTVPAALVDDSTYPAVLDPVLSPELGPDRPVVAPENPQGGLGAACGPDLCLAAWAQYRDGRRQTVATRISAGGDVLDPGGLVVSTGWDGRRRDRRTAVATDGRDFLVVVQRLDPSEHALRVARVTAAGELPDAPDGVPLALSAAVGFGSVASMGRPVVAYGGGRYLVAWGQQASPGTDLNLLARFVDHDAQPMGEVISVNAYGGDQTADAIAYNGDHFVIAGSNASSGSNEMAVFRVTFDGLPLTFTPAVDPDPADDLEATLATDGRDTLLVWRRGEDTLRGVVVGRESVGDAFDVVPAGAGAMAPTLAGDGHRYLVIWQVQPADTLRGRLLDRAGGAQGEAFDVAFDAPYAEPRVAALDGQFLVVAHRTLDGVVARRISPSGDVRDPLGVPVSTRVVNTQITPAVATDGARFLLVWADDRGGLVSQIFGARVSAAGALLDPGGLVIADSPADKGEPAVAWSGTQYLVVWDTLREGTRADIEGVRLSPDGRRLAGVDVLTLNGDQLRPRVIWDGEHFFVVWEDWRGPDADVIGARVEPSGLVLDPGGFGIASAPDDQTAPALAYDGVKVHVVFEDWSAGGTFAPDVAEVRVLPGGLVVDGAPRTVVAADGRQASPAVVWDGAESVVVFFTDDRAGEALDVRATRVTREGVVVHADGFIVAGGPGDQSEPAAALGGTTRILATWTTRPGAEPSDVHGRYLNARTLRPLGLELTLAAASDAESASAVSFGPGGSALVAFEADVQAWDRRRVRAVFVHEAAVP